MDKYENAIANYERWRQEIQRLTYKIAECSYDFDEGIRYAPCKDLDNGATCVERYWSQRQSMAFYFGKEAVDNVDSTMCGPCKKVDCLVQERKAAKQQFGIAKRRLSAIGKALLKTAHSWAE